MANSMRNLQIFFALLIIAGCRSENFVVVEEHSPIVQGSLLSENVGIETMGGVLTPILNSGCKIPCTLTKVFSTAEDNQDQITITLVRGQQKMARQGVNLGKYRVSGIEPAPRGTPQIEVEFTASSGSILLFARDISNTSKIKLEAIE